MIVRIGNYEIRPYSNRLCWELFEFRKVKSKKDGTVTDKWVSMEQYPSTLGSALATVHERLIMDEPGTKDVHAAITTSKRLYDSLMSITTKAREVQ